MSIFCYISSIMTVDEFIDRFPGADGVARYMVAHPDTPVRIWDNMTVDITVPQSTTLKKYLSGFSCLACGCAADGPEPGGNDKVCGVFRTCTSCGARFFIHKHVPFGGTT